MVGVISVQYLPVAMMVAMVQVGMVAMAVSGASRAFHRPVLSLLQLHRKGRGREHITLVAGTGDTDQGIRERDTLARTQGRG